MVQITCFIKLVAHAYNMKRKEQLKQQQIMLLNEENLNKMLSNKQKLFQAATWNTEAGSKTVEN